MARQLGVGKKKKGMRQARKHECLVSIFPRLLFTPAKSAAKTAAKRLERSLAKIIGTSLETALQAGIGEALALGGEVIVEKRMGD